jgi:CRISPR type III-B/RAMP module-associated protein Cmr5
LSVSTENVKAALIDIEKVKELIDRTKIKFGSEFRTRAEEFLGYLGTSGLLPTLTFYYAKTEGKYSKIVDVFEKKSEKPDCNERQLAYWTYLHLILGRITSLGFLEENKDPLACFKKLAELDPFKLSLIFTQIVPYCEELAKICEATFERRER